MRERFLARSAGGNAGSNPRRRSASSLETIDRPTSCAYARMRDWMVLCSPGVGIFQGSGVADSTASTASGVVVSPIIML